ncbi:putative ankyrin repeat protein [Porphyridium purpureum]|uniref:Putative ankyrin repeat protein n=1 Tax=Porphyridium purpureum TaxID=35688 RepID=A0A5J4YMK2_PORPP|nr:putative ankyrin repeat protein [Porphyridium purpureum]|eukprot:POR3829..scf246_12
MLLCDAASGGDESEVARLLQLGAFVDERNSEDATPLICAARSGSWSCVQLLLSHGADVNAEDKSARTAWMYSVIEGHDESLRALLEHGVDLRATQHFSWINQINEQRIGAGTCLRLLAAHGFDVNARSPGGWSYLHEAAYYSKERFVSVLLELGADANAQCNRGFTALMSAIASEDYCPFIVLLLIQHGAQVNAADERGMTALLYAAAEINNHCVGILLRHGACVLSKAHDGSNALHKVLGYMWYPMPTLLDECRLGIMHLLVRHGVLVNGQDVYGRAPLDVWSTSFLLALHDNQYGTISCWGWKHVFELLVQCGADINRGAEVECGTATALMYLMMVLGTKLPVLLEQKDDLYYNALQKAAEIESTLVLNLGRLSLAHIRRLLLEDLNEWLSEED